MSEKCFKTIVTPMDSSPLVMADDLYITARMQEGWSVHSVDICNGVRYTSIVKDSGLADLKILLDSELGTSDEPFFIRVAELVESYKQLTDFMNFEYYSKGKNPFAMAE